MVDQEAPRLESKGNESTGRAIKRDGPFWLAVGLSVAGGLYMLLGRLTILPWISDERRRESIRHVWGALSRNLPDIGYPALEKIGFWILISAVAALCVALLVLASSVSDGEEPGTGKAA